MTEQKFGRIIARGSDAFVALVKQALDDCSVQRIEDLPRRDFFIEEHSPAEFRAAGYIIKATGDTAEGHVVPGGLWLNSRTVKNYPRRARHIVRHEIGHVVPLSLLKRTALMALMTDASGRPPTDWKQGGYLDKPYECFADSFAEAVSGIDSPWDDFAFYRLDVLDAVLPKFVTIVMTPDPTPPPPAPEPIPLPPVDPMVEKLKARVLVLEAAVAEISDTAQNVKEPA